MSSCIRTPCSPTRCCVPSQQDSDVFADGVANIVATHQRVAQSYFTDGSIALACPPLKALLEIMAYGKTADGLGLESPEVRALFTRESVLASDWYAARLDAKQRGDEGASAKPSRRSTTSSTGRATPVSPSASD